MKKCSYLPNKLRNFNKIFRKNLCYDNIKSHKKPGLYPLFRKYNFGKTTRGGRQIDPQAFLGLICVLLIVEIFSRKSSPWLVLVDEAIWWLFDGAFFKESSNFDN